MSADVASVGPALPPPARGRPQAWGPSCALKDGVVLAQEFQNGYYFKQQNSLPKSDLNKEPIHENTQRQNSLVNPAAPTPMYFMEPRGSEE